MSKNAKIARAFDRAAHQYDDVADVQKRVGIRLAHHYLFDTSATKLTRAVSTKPATMLDGGCGTGYHHDLLRKHDPDAYLTAYDLSATMLQLAAQHSDSCVCGDLESLPFQNNSFSLIWSNLALQWCQPERAYPELYRALEKDGALVFSTLVSGTLHEFDTAFSGADNYRHVGNFAGAQDSIAGLRAAGFNKIQHTVERWVTYHADFSALLASIREIGASSKTVVSNANDRSQPRRSMMGKTVWQAMQRRYETLGNAAGYLPATYRVLFVRATK